MSVQSWVEATGIPLPKCKMQGCCCRAASPSVPAHQLLQKAAAGEEFARNFFSIFVPHANHDAARAVVPGLVERTLKAARKDAAFASEEDVVFYQCRYIGEDNKCRIWEDRPDLCRAYPDSPFMVFAPDCAFEPWAHAVKARFEAMKAEVETLKAARDAMLTDESGTDYTKIDAIVQADDNFYSLSMVLLLTPVYLVSPLSSYLAGA